MRGRSNKALQAAGWIERDRGGCWSLSSAGRAYVRSLLAAYTRDDAARDLAGGRLDVPGPSGRSNVRERESAAARRRRLREPVFSEKARRAQRTGVDAGVG